MIYFWKKILYFRNFNCNITRKDNNKDHEQLDYTNLFNHKDNYLWLNIYIKKKIKK
jgi:hypothetical protein